MPDLVPCRLYLITPPQFSLPAFLPLCEEALQGGDVACLQLRMKQVPASAIEEAGKALQTLCHRYNIPLIINDDVELMQHIGADGVHIGEEEGAGKEGSIATLRQKIGDTKVIGVSCYNSRDLAMIAGDEGADYVSFGACFPTTTKQAKTRVSLDMFTWWDTLCEIPSVAIGGITVDNTKEVVAAGADFIAMVAGIWDYKAGPKAAVAEVNKAIEEGMRLRACLPKQV